MRYVFKAIDFVISVVFLALCTKALCVHFYQDIERQLDGTEASDKPSSGRNCYCAIAYTASFSVGSSASAFELLTRFDTGQRSLPRSRCAALVVTEHKQPYRRREISALAVTVDAADQIGQRSPAARGDIFQALPEGILKADACLVSCKHD